ncbi:MAG: excinuclease ABC subunit UvrC [Clostridia bacterium]|nr:excinuclease ABC subunit UvrC [Clostridia bacterium]
MVNPEFADHLREKSAGLPLSPGVYIMHDKNGKVIYVGKSRKLKNRVSQYFHDDTKGAKTDAMTYSVADFEYILCDTEIEALSLENSLIKLYKPRYNIKLKDDKSYPYLKATVDEEYPRFVMTRRREGGRSLYFGPYTSTSTVYGIISAMQKTFGIPSCHRTFPRDKGKIKNCIYMQIGCCAPCRENVTAEEYREAFMQAVSFLSGNTDDIVEMLTEKMKQASQMLAFETAALYRNRIQSIRRLAEKQKVVDAPDIERDIVAWQSAEPIPSACVFYIRGGKLIESETFFFGANEIMDSSAVTSFIYGLYTNREYIPKEVFLSDDLTEDDMLTLSEWLNTKTAYKVTLHTPKRGAARKTCDLARSNAIQKAQERFKEEGKSDKTLVRLASIAGLEVVPERIEAYDISNIGNENITGGMVVFENGKPQKSEYRLFGIKDSQSQDDYGAMRETLRRRFRHLSDDGARAPDLILIDGGAQHVTVAYEVLAEYGLNIPALGMVKDKHHKTRALVGCDGEISIAIEQNVFVLIYSIQEEVHRFTVGKVTKAKRKNESTSVLREIDGIGEAKARALLVRFGGLRGVKNATPAQLIEVTGITPALAEKIAAYFEKGEKT